MDRIGIAALLMRTSLGIMFLAHGLLKVFVFTLPGTAGFFASQGFPGWAAYPVTAFEILGGLALMAGWQTRRVALAGIPVLAGALLVHLPHGWVFSAPNGGWEYPAFLIAASLVTALLGDGAYALGRTVSGTNGAKQVNA
jgi:putative oxidoreductase